MIAVNQLVQTGFTATTLKLTLQATHSEGLMHGALECGSFGKTLKPTVINPRKIERGNESNIVLNGNDSGKSALESSYP